MATKVLNNWYVLLNSVDLSAYVRNVSPSLQQETADDTAGSNVTAREHVPTIKNATVSIAFNLELGAGAVEATLWAVYLGGAEVALHYAADGSTPAAANPVYQQNVVLTSFPPFEGDVGSKGEVTAQFQVTGAITRDITP
jgi:hypothetical protein